MSALKVQRRQCETCIFRSKYWSAEHLAALLDQIRDPAMQGHFISYRVCHHSKDAICAGFWARHRDNFDLGQLAQRLGWVKRVQEDDPR